MNTASPHLLASGELELGTPQSLHHVRLELIQRPDGDDRLADLHAGNQTLRLAKRTAHSCLEPDRGGTGVRRWYFKARLGGIDQEQVTSDNYVFNHNIPKRDYEIQP